MENLSGRWQGEISGTNSGKLDLTLAQDGQTITGLCSCFEPALGRYEYEIEGSVVDGFDLVMTPKTNPLGIQLGKVQVKGRIVASNELDGIWLSTIGTQGVFKATRRVENGQTPSRVNQPIFLAHGHDEAAKEKVARLLSKLGIAPVILHEQESKSRTIIEKLEHYSRNVGYAIAIFTPDDLGRKNSKDEIEKPRARQNVLLECGYFVGLLKRSGVCILYKQGVELPSDLLGVTHIPIDGGGWELELAKEIRAAGYTIDLNKL